MDWRKHLSSISCVFVVKKNMLDSQVICGVIYLIIIFGKVKLD